ncbi:hypothetical protein [Maioricimonas sp. JC845]|uniref:hypothetical protein n=1 Tax=Maioricimonas sp. JC845 TaxID=3232138 RepID=UPI0034574DB3
MSATKKLKASEKQAVVKKLTTLLKKEYGGSLPKANRPVLETVLFAICLERSGYDDAQAAYDRLLEAFFDLNEIRVSSVSEIEQALGELDDAAWKALRIRETLQYVFEKYYQFDFDGLRRKTLEAAQKQLEEINHITPFVQGYVLQQCLGAHVVPLDSGSRDALVWMGLVDPETDVQHAADEMKSALRKSDGPLFSHLLHCLAVDRRRNGAFEPAEVAQNGSSADPETAADRLKNLLEKGFRRKKVVKSRKKPATKTTATRKKAAKGAAKKVVKKKVSKPKAKTRTRSRKVAKS